MEKSHSPHYFLLESSLGGRYTIEAWDPVEVIEAKPGKNFFALLRSKLRETPHIDAPDMPFAGGWIGYLSYELYDEIESSIAPRPTTLIPRAVFARYDRFEIHEGRKHFQASPSTPHPASSVTSESTREDYIRKVEKIRELIEAGDCYQVNLSQKFSSIVQHPSDVIYRRLREISPSPFAAYLNLGDAQILSSSPESFLSVDQRHVTTRPIKGTRSRGATADEDSRLVKELEGSEKDRAELLMITDLERSDLGRVCIPGSVRVSELAKVESYPQVHHLVSTIEGDLSEGKDIVDLLRAVFPGGSITGAPKIRAMQIIREIEPHTREVYCGAIGFISSNGKAQFNVAIRTMVIKDGSAHFWSGGGIVADSEPEAEYEEMLTKAKGMMEALGVNGL